LNTFHSNRFVTCVFDGSYRRDLQATYCRTLFDGVYHGVTVAADDPIWIGTGGRGLPSRRRRWWLQPSGSRML